MIPRLANLPVYLAAGRAMSPGEVAAKVLLRLGIGPAAALRRMAIVADHQRFRPERALRLLGELEAAARSRLGEPAIDFAGASVLEVGCGPLGGFGPIAVARGARSYEGYDPAWSGEVFGHRRIVEGYLRPLHDRAGGDPQARDFLSRCAYHATGIEARTSLDKVDLALSVSCLEHIDDPAGALAALARASTPATRHLHLVNFSNHRSKAHPFATIYEMPRAAYHRRYGRHINLMRPSDLAGACAAAGFDCRIEPVSVVPEALDGLTIHKSWLERYAREELAVRTAIVGLALRPDRAEAG